MGSATLTKKSSATLNASCRYGLDLFIEQIAIEQIGRGVYLARIIDPRLLLQVRIVA